MIVGKIGLERVKRLLKSSTNKNFTITTTAHNAPVLFPYPKFYFKNREEKGCATVSLRDSIAYRQANTLYQDCAFPERT